MQASPPSSALSPTETLHGLAALSDESIDLGEAALALAAIARPGVALAEYRAHLATLADDLRERVGNSTPELEERRAALNDVLLDRHGYAGDTMTYDDIQNADLIRVIDRRKGLPVTLGILYIQTARSLGWAVAGLNFPGHFLIRLETAGERLIVDPFNEGRRREAADLRDLLKLSAGLDAELVREHYDSVGNRDILIRLQNNIKARHMQSGDLAAAEQVIDTMLLFAPNFAGLWREAGLVRAGQGRLGAAIEAIERYAETAGTDAARSEADGMIQKLRRQLN